VKFDGAFRSIVHDTGARFENYERFHALTGTGKPLWEFKEHDHRIYCHRKVEGDRVNVVLLHGWIKDKKGRSLQEGNEVTRAQNLLQEFLAEVN
jgi:hypothetical protein